MRRVIRTLESARPDDLWLALLRDVGSSVSGSGTGTGTVGPTLPFGYELEALIGRGGMGVVHRARQLGLDRRVALKMIAAGRDASPYLVERFRREVEAAASLNHPAIVPIHDVGVRDGVPFYAMELLEGGTLADRLAAGPLAIPDAVGLVERLARAVDHAHRQGIIHRDLKPSNILFDAEGTAKVSDFGLAKRLDADPDAAATRSSLLLGTPTYMAPEQASGRPEAVGLGVNVHALGAILFECLTGRPPFLGPNPLEYPGADPDRRASQPHPVPLGDLRRPGDDLPDLPGEEIPPVDTPQPPPWPTTWVASHGARPSLPGPLAGSTVPSSGPAAGPPRPLSPPCSSFLWPERSPGCSPIRRDSARP